MELTKEQAIAEHRKMWRWIAEETEKRQELVYLEDYCIEYFPDDSIVCWSFCCEYDNQKKADIADYLYIKCKFCPIDWDSKHNSYMCLYKEIERDWKGLYSLWLIAENWKEAAKLAKQIAELPERFGDVFDDE